mmetsp:Transcript_87778/g.226233  ORF Transcript_87778/g.226233 Transcript_87778/m.226233 type:complete len:296 (-) Transcript_87778:144-1031(-)
MVQRHPPSPGTTRTELGRGSGGTSAASTLEVQAAWRPRRRSGAAGRSWRALSGPSRAPPRSSGWSALPATVPTRPAAVPPCPSTAPCWHPHPPPEAFPQASEAHLSGGVAPAVPAASPPPPPPARPPPPPLACTWTSRRALASGTSAAHHYLAWQQVLSSTATQVRHWHLLLRRQQRLRPQPIQLGPERSRRPTRLAASAAWCLGRLRLPKSRLPKRRLPCCGGRGLQSRRLLAMVSGSVVSWLCCLQRSRSRPLAQQAACTLCAACRRVFRVTASATTTTLWAAVRSVASYMAS